MGRSSSCGTALVRAGTLPTRSSAATQVCQMMSSLWLGQGQWLAALRHPVLGMCPIGPRRQ
eukprot:2160024-Karenia_brevis.AAC.1